MILITHRNQVRDVEILHTYLRKKKLSKIIPIKFRAI
jgi:hypothetical protein